MMYNNNNTRENTFTMENLNATAHAVCKQKNAQREAKMRAKMEPYRKACEKAARNGKFSMAFRAGYGIFHKVSPVQFQCYFTMNREFVIDTRSKKGYVVVRWDDESIKHPYGF
jgi:hypothetical protein